MSSGLSGPVRVSYRTTFYPGLTRTLRSSRRGLDEEGQGCRTRETYPLPYVIHELFTTRFFRTPLDYEG